jgi:NADPH-dependent F420 reductase
MAKKVGIVGGTGKQGTGLALRWAKTHEVIIGSRDRERAEAQARESSAAGGVTIRGASNLDVAREAEIVALTVPYAAHAATLRDVAEALPGKVLIDMTVPLVPPKVAVVHLPPGQAAALEARAIVGAEVKIVAALHHVSSVHLADLSHALEGDVLVCGDDAAAKAAVMELIADLGLRGVDAGALENAIALEALTPVLLSINKRYKIRGAGIRILGIP